MELEDLGEQLYNLLAQVLNRPENRAFFDSIRGEYGVLCIGEKGTYHKTEK